MPDSHETATVGSRIKGAREAKNWTQGDLAEAVRVDRVMVSRWERNEATPRVRTSLRIGEALGVNADWILKGVPMQTVASRSQTSDPLDALLDAIDAQPTREGKRRALALFRDDVARKMKTTTNRILQQSISAILDLPTPEI